LALLEISDLLVSYGKAAVLLGISLSLHDGEFIGVIGPNGVGKTTLLRAISGLTPARGDIRFANEMLNHLPVHEIVRKGIILCPERRRLFAEMTVLRNLEMGAYLRADKKEIRQDLEKIFELFPRLKERGKNMASTLSGGEQQMLAVARSLMASPKLLMLDEPSFGLAPLVKQLITAILKEIQKKGMTILLSEQDALLALNTAERIYVLENGRIAIEGSREDLMANLHVKEAYLGLA
jgi:branched-chain amino acid transport system ATP-binding protein